MTRNSLRNSPKYKIPCNFQAFTIRRIVCIEVGYRMSDSLSDNPTLRRSDYTVWTGWISPILEDYCENFYLMSVLFFFVQLFSSPVTFYDISSDFWYWEIFFLSQIGDNPKGYPLEIFENDHSVFKKSFQISKCDAKTILKKSLKLT